MIFSDKKVSEIKIAYIGGGSRGWAWGFMSDLVSADDISGDVYLYDINFEAAKHNEIIGNKFNDCEGAKSKWTYHTVKTAKEAMSGADFVIISIQPGDFDDMESDVHTPEKYGIYQPVGDSTGPGGIVRAMRTIPMFEEIAKNVKEYCPNAWVINYTNPMTLCTKALYSTFPEIKAFGCCHEVYGTQETLARALEEAENIKIEDRREIKVNPIGINHFTWLTDAKYHNIDVFPAYEKFADKYIKDGYIGENPDSNWMNSAFFSTQQVKLDLFKRFGYIAAAGDRHLSEFCEGSWYLKNPETVKKYGFALTSVAWRKDDLKRRLKKSEDLRNGTEKIKIENTGEEGVQQIRAILGLHMLVTNVNIPNKGQIPNLPLGAVVETNAVFTNDTVTPVFAGSIPKEIYPLISRICTEQEIVAKGIMDRDAKLIFSAFANDPLVTCDLDDAKKMFLEMCENTKEYLTDYNFNF